MPQERELIPWLVPCQQRRREPRRIVTEPVGRGLPDVMNICMSNLELCSYWNVRPQ
jgi:hypothetical protein